MRKDYHDAIHPTLLCAAIVVLNIPAIAGNVLKADNADNLNLGSSWAGGIPPALTDLAVWDNTVTTANTTLLGANLTWAGIEILDPGGLVTISAGNTLTLGASGIDMSLATNSLTLNNSNILGASQRWNVVGFDAHRRRRRFRLGRHYQNRQRHAGARRSQ